MVYTIAAIFLLTIIGAVMLDKKNEELRQAEKEKNELKIEVERWQNIANDCVNGEVPKFIAENLNLTITLNKVQKTAKETSITQRQHIDRLQNEVAEKDFELKKWTTLFQKYFGYNFEPCVENMENKIEKLQSELESTRKQNSLINENKLNTVKKSHGEIVKLQSEMKEKDAEIERLRQKCAVLNGIANQLQSELTELKERHKSDIINAIASCLYEAGDDDLEQEFHYKKAEQYYKEKFESNENTILYNS